MEAANVNDLYETHLLFPFYSPAQILLGGKSMESKHTPGPWVARKEHGGYLSLWHDNANFLDLYLYGNEANARLILAAPELLTALKETVAVLKQSVEDDGAAESVYETLTDAEHAIAKVEGV